MSDLTLEDFWLNAVASSDLRKYRAEAIRDINRERRPAREKLFAGIQEAIERDEKK